MILIKGIATFKIMTSFFSIITVSKNNYKELKQTLDSIKSLKSDNFEWIPVLSGNCSSSLNLVSKKYSFKVNPTINQDKNLWDAMNIGINKSVNKYLIFMNAGDTFYDKYVLSKISIIINNHNYPDLIYGNTVELINGTKNYKKSLNHKFIKYGMFANHQSIFFKKKILNQYDLKYNFKDFPNSADYALLAEIITKKTSIKYVDEYISNFLSGGTSYRPKYILTGRKEQILIKKNILKINIFEIYFYSCLQKFLWFVRKHFFKTYKVLRFQKK
tara:strand:+ start:613 stop:1431 length:819 start_codon:yes stop_codon:yes gene_type:complete